MKPIALISTRKGLFALNEDLKLQILGFEGVPVSMALASAQHDVMYAGLDHGHFGVKLHRSDNKGKDWVEVNAPAYPADEENKSKSVELIWSLEFADESKSEILWAGTIPGGLFYSEDGGQNWTLNKALNSLQAEHEWMGGGYDKPGIHSICIHPEHPQTITLGVSVAGVYRSEDGGKSWLNKSKGMRAAYLPPEMQFNAIGQDPHRLVQSRSNPSVFWVQHHNGIFFSKDDANSWEEIDNVDPSTFGFASVIHPDDENKVWFVPGVKDECRVPVDANLVVTRTRDGGANFEKLNQGLPKQSYDLILRHAMDIDATGERLLMGSTTGNVWMSENQGDSWNRLSNYLPPVYAVRFL